MVASGTSQYPMKHHCRRLCRLIKPVGPRPSQTRPLPHVLLRSLGLRFRLFDSFEFFWDRIVSRQSWAGPHPHICQIEGTPSKVARIVQPWKNKDKQPVKTFWKGNENSRNQVCKKWRILQKNAFSATNSSHECSRCMWLLLVFFKVFSHLGPLFKWLS